VLEGFRGQNVASRIVANVLARDAVPHAYLLFGQRGLGKRAAALSLGRLLACHAPRLDAPSVPEPCEVCPSCVLPFRPGGHHDLVCVEPEAPDGKSRDGAGTGSGAMPAGIAGGIVKVEQVREAERRLNKSRVAGKRRICIIPDAERMCRVPAAGNAFLKTLEEPPARTVVILTSGNMAELLPTMVSRCLLLPFVPLVESDLVDLLAAERDGSSDRRSRERLAARIAGGRPELARALLCRPNALALRDRALDVLHRALRGDRLASLRDPDELCDVCVEWWLEASGTDAEDAPPAQGRERLIRAAAPEVLSLLESYMRDMIACAVGVPGDSLANGDRVAELREAAALFSPAQIRECRSILGRARRAVGQNANCRLAFEAALLQMGKRGARARNRPEGRN